MDHDLKTAASNMLHDKNLQRLVAPSLLGAIICLFCFIGATWAWFTANASVDIEEIQSAQYSVSIDMFVLDESSESVAGISPRENSELPSYAADMPIELGKTYSIRLTPNGETSTGYCIIEADGQAYYTDNLPEEGILFTYKGGFSNESIHSAADYDAAVDSWNDSLVITWCWGTYPNTLPSFGYAEDELSLLEDGDAIGHTLPQRPEETASYNISVENAYAVLDSTMSVEATNDLIISLTADDDSTLPDEVVLAIGEKEYSIYDSNEENEDGLTYSHSGNTGEIMIPAEVINEYAGNANFTATVILESGIPSELSVSVDETHYTLSGAEARGEMKSSGTKMSVSVSVDALSGIVSPDDSFITTLSAKDGYELPDDISVSGASAYSYDKESGELYIPSSAISDGTEISVSIEAKEKKKEEEEKEEKASKEADSGKTSSGSGKSNAKSGDENETASNDADDENNNEADTASNTSNEKNTAVNANSSTSDNTAKARASSEQPSNDESAN